MSVLPPPVNVSPLIRFGRWSLLTVGVAYGLFHQNRLAKREVGIREVETKQKAIRDAKITAEKKAASDKEMAELEAMTK